MVLVQKELKNAYIGIPNPTSIALNKVYISLTTVGQTEQLTATIEPTVSDKTITWTSSDNTIATIDSTGLVTCVTPGECTITATTVNGLTATCSVDDTQGWQPGENTVAYYPLTANANDYSGNGYNATNYDGVFTEANGGYFGTYTSRLELPSMVIGQTFTINIWTKLPNGQPTGYQQLNLYYDWSGPYRNILFAEVSGGIICNTGNNSTSQRNKTVSATFGTGWNNIVLSKTGTSYSVYMNGNLLETFTSSFNITIPGGSNTVVVAHDSGGTSEYSALGYIKDYIIEDKARTAQEIADYYDQTKSNYGL